MLAHVEAQGLAYDPLLGWVRDPVPDYENHIEEHGFRTLERFEDDKPDGTWRAFVFGDSQTYGAGVDVDKTYASLTLLKLREARPDLPIEIINTGVSGYGSLQALRLIQHEILQYEPDMLIIDCRVNDQPRDQLVQAAPVLPAVDRLLFNWRTWYVLRFVIERARGDTTPMRADAMDHGPQQPAGNHDLIMAVAQDARVDVVFLDYPFWDMRRPEGGPQPTIMCMAPASQLPPGADVIPVCQALIDAGRPASELFLDNNHLTEEGHRVVAERLASGLLERLPGG